nr:Uncharacterised protein [Klebsiella pneumoniae]
MREIRVVRDIAGDKEEHWRQGTASVRQAELIVTKQIAGVDLIRHIRQLFRHTVRDDHIRLLFEGSGSRTTRELKNSSSCITGS